MASATIPARAMATPIRLKTQGLALAVCAAVAARPSSRRASARRPRASRAIARNNRLRASLRAFFADTFSTSASPSRVAAARYLPSYMSSSASDRRADGLAGDASARSKVVRALATSPASHQHEPVFVVDVGRGNPPRIQLERALVVAHRVGRRPERAVAAREVDVRRHVVGRHTQHLLILRDGLVEASELPQDAAEVVADAEVVRVALQVAAVQIDGLVPAPELVGVGRLDAALLAVGRPLCELDRLVEVRLALLAVAEDEAVVGGAEGGVCLGEPGILVHRVEMEGQGGPVLALVPQRDAIGVELQRLDRGRRDLLEGMVAGLDDGQRLAQVAAQRAGDRAERPQHMVAIVGVLDARTHDPARLRFDEPRRQRVLRPHPRDARRDEPAHVLPLANLAAGLFVDGVVPGLAHALQARRGAGTREDVGEPRLLEQARERRHQRAIEQGLAGLVVEVGDQDEVPRPEAHRLPGWRGQIRPDRHEHEDARDGEQPAGDVVPSAPTPRWGARHGGDGPDR